MSRSLATIAGAALAAALFAGCGKTTPLTSATTAPPTPVPVHMGIEYAIPTANSAPVALVRGGDGAVWFVENASSKIGYVAGSTTPGSVTGTIYEFALPTINSSPLGITEGPDAAMWITESRAGKIARTPLSNPGSYIEVNLQALNPLSTPSGISSGADGAMWVTDPGANGIWRVTAGTSPIPAFTALPTGAANPGAIASGPDGQLWFVETASNKIGAITTSAAPYTVTEYPVPTAAAGLSAIAAGSDNALWFIESSTDKIGRINLSGQVTNEYSLAPLKTPEGLTLGNDGNFYISDPGGNQVAQFNPLTQQINVYAAITAGSTPYGIGLGPDSEVYFTEKTGDKIGQLIYF